MADVLETRAAIQSTAQYIDGIGEVAKALTTLQNQQKIGFEALQDFIYWRRAPQDEPTYDSAKKAARAALVEAAQMADEAAQSISDSGEEALQNNPTVQPFVDSVVRSFKFWISQANLHQIMSVAERKVSTAEEEVHQVLLATRNFISTAEEEVHLATTNARHAHAVDASSAALVEADTILQQHEQEYPPDASNFGFRSTLQIPPDAKKEYRGLKKRHDKLRAESALMMLVAAFQADPTGQQTATAEAAAQERLNSVAADASAMSGKNQPEDVEQAEYIDHILKAAQALTTLRDEWKSGLEAYQKLKRALQQGADEEDAAGVEAARAKLGTAQHFSSSTDVRQIPGGWCQPHVFDGRTPWCSILIVSAATHPQASTDLQASTHAHRSMMHME